MNCQFLNSTDYEKWNSFVANSPQGSVFCKTYYLDALQIQYKILCTENSGEILSGIILAKNELNTYSNPFLVKHLGILFKSFDGKTDSKISNEIKNSELLIKNIKKLKTFDYLFHPNYTFWLPFYWSNFNQQTYYTYRINLTYLNEKNLINLFSKDLRSSIKNFEKADYQFVENIPFDVFYNLINQTFIRQGGKFLISHKKLEYFYEHLKIHQCVKLYGLVNNQNDITATSMIVYDKNCAYLLFNAFDRNLKEKGTNEYIIYHTILRTIYISKYFDFEGSMIKNIESFYRKFGGELTPYMRIWRDNIFNYFKQKSIYIFKKIRYGK